ncbi:hypothetical protein SRHO_G00315290 [Serrasalmus rhombeus]
MVFKGATVPAVVFRPPCWANGGITPQPAMALAGRMCVEPGLCVRLFNAEIRVCFYVGELITASVFGPKEKGREKERTLL